MTFPPSFMPLRLRAPIVLLLALALGGCSGDADTGPISVKWDRDACSHCSMVLSDRNHAAQIRYTPPGKQRSRVALFDDIGCALVWLQEQPWKADPKLEIWVADWRNSTWIDARKATYLPGQVTPMEYGLGAQSDPDPKGLDFDQAQRHIFDLERRFNVHGAHLEHHAQERR